MSDVSPGLAVSSLIGCFDISHTLLTHRNVNHQLIKEMGRGRGRGKGKGEGGRRREGGGRGYLLLLNHSSGKAYP